MRATRPPILMRLARRAPAAIGLLLFLGAAFVVSHAFRHFHLRDVASAIAATPKRTLGFAALWTLAAYVVLTFYDRLATSYAGHRVAWRRTAFASFCAYVLSHNLGFSAVSGGAVRFRLYSAWGLPPSAIARIIAFCSFTFFLGVAAMLGAVALVAPKAVPVGGVAIPPLAIRALGLAIWTLIVAYALLARRTPVLRLAGHEIRLPGPGTAVRQVALAVTDVATTSAIVFTLLPAAHGLTYPRFVTIYLASYVAGLLANVPGGLGVFETALLLGLGPYLPAPAILGAAVLFRLYYYIVPLFLAGTMFALHELYLRGVSLFAVLRPIPTRPSGVVRGSEADFSVAVSTGLVVLCGAALLAAGAIAPVAAHPMNIVGLPFFTHAGAYAVSLLGAALVVLAVGLAHRVTLAWGSSILLLLLAAPLCLAEQQPLWLAGAVALAALLMLPYRHAYYRHARLLSEPFHPRTAAPLLLLAGCVLALGLLAPDFSYLEESSWWQVVLSADLPERLRGGLLLLVLLLLGTTWGLIRPGRVVSLDWNEACRRRFTACGVAPPADADGVVLGETGRSCIAFRRVGSMLVGIGDPAGPTRDRMSAIWRLRDLALQEGRRAAVWRAGPELLDVWNDIGLTAWKLEPDGRPTWHEPVECPAAGIYLCCPDEAGLTTVLAALPSGEGGTDSVFERR